MNDTPTSIATQYRTFDEVFDRFRYPAGESHLQLRPEASATISTTLPLVIEAGARSFDDLGQLVTADRVLRRNDLRAQWFVPYFPFARHDRRNHAGDGFELEVALAMVAELDLIIADPHSEVAARIPHIAQQSVVALLRDRGAFDDDPIVVVPDAGAAEKIDTWVGDATTVQALKRRDPATGKLSGFELLADDLGGRPCIVIDDICDGGGTFLGLAEQLRRANAGPLTLAVTHGLFTKGTDALADAYAQIITFARTAPAATRPAFADHEQQCRRVQTHTFSDLYRQDQKANQVST